MEISCLLAQTPHILYIALYYVWAYADMKLPNYLSMNMSKGIINQNKEQSTNNEITSRYLHFSESKIIF